ncbi:hypothetical protein B0T18DRAFT_393800 [Schizothecium vesticola]|uniref:Ilp is an apoptosis inhibitor n=1 Tax=Schizothecium vesticola TaxID=314040 RepID=A0AA40EKT6_9PEZI|nr:hypothetical protein B0T18DRAFT_393800 [Schizothecium vesticola]
MAFVRGNGPSFAQDQPFLDGQFDVFEWHPYFQSCVRYFLDHAQYNGPVQALAAFINIQLPFQKANQPVLSARPSGGGGGSPASAAAAAAAPNNKAGAGVIYPNATLVPYLRRLVATGFDLPAVLHGFFGDDWAAGVGPLHEQERRNYLFAAKSDSWLRVKAAYDMGEDETVPFLRPLQNVSEKEIVGAEVGWSEWLAMQDWMLGPRAPPPCGSGGGGAGGMGMGTGMGMGRGGWGG